VEFLFTFILPKNPSMKKFLLPLLFIALSIQSYAVCPAGFSTVIIYIIPDNYDYEVSWDIQDDQGNIFASGDSSQSDTLCIPSTSCKIFSIHDQFGDGIISPGGYWVYVDGNLLANGSNFGSIAQFTFNCPPGNFCNGALPITLGNHTAPFDNTWYEYTPTASGNYNLTTCGLNTCNTKIWIYTSCPSIPYQEGVQGTFAYNDDNNCGTQADVNIVLTAGTRYLIRIGDNQDSCIGSVDFNFSYLGPITGCMDITACNYNPLATADDGSCIYPPNPNCAGPDLQFDSLRFIQSLSMQSHNTAPCDVDEGCVTGYGTRYVITFTSRINNIGLLDFYIGNETTQPGMFNTNNCHGHDHYEGYGDYRLFDSNGNMVPAGHKNGFCVIDLCGFGQYTCGNMGISAGCYDSYGAGTQCQWIDITDVPTGDYRLAVIINSKHLPDALGHYETNYINNALQVCMHIDHNTGGSPSYSLLPNCTPYVDCSGLPGGNSELDCNGVCNGPLVFGDMFPDAVLDDNDVYTYLDLIQSTMPATNCNDLNRDTRLSIYDAALVNWCRRGNPLHPGGSAHNHCNFPRNIDNPNDLVGLGIEHVDFTDNYIDVQILNPSAKIKAYQFTISGATISSVVSLANPVLFPVDVRFNSTTNEVFAISLEDSSLDRGIVPQPLVRIYFSATTDTLICISAIADVVNQDAERTIASVIGQCVPSEITSIGQITNQVEMVLLPNPAQDRLFVHLSAEGINMNELTIMDISGKTFSLPKQVYKNSWYEVDINDLPAGVYIVKFSNNNSYGVSRFVKL
jgi:hypothetical protein